MHACTYRKSDKSCSKVKKVQNSYFMKYPNLLGETEVEENKMPPKSDFILDVSSEDDDGSGLEFTSCTLTS